MYLVTSVCAVEAGTKIKGHFVHCIECILKMQHCLWPVALLFKLSIFWP